MNNIICDECGKSYSLKGIATHKWRTHGAGILHNPNIGYKSGRINALKGKTYDQLYDPVKSAKIKQAGSDANKGRIHSKENLEKFSKQMSQTMKRLYAEGWQGPTWCKKYKYQSPIAGEVILDGTWELKYARYLDSIGKNWIRNTLRFNYFDENSKTRTYCPDFYLPDLDLFIEIKGRETAIDKLKWAVIPNLKILRKHDLCELGIL